MEQSLPCRSENAEVRFGSLADLLPKFSLTSAFGGKAVVGHAHMSGEIRFQQTSETSTRGRNLIADQDDFALALSLF